VSIATATRNTINKKIVIIIPMYQYIYKPTPRATLPHPSAVFPTIKLLAPYCTHSSHEPIIDYTLQQSLNYSSWAQGCARMLILSHFEGARARRQ
jgi:hypothetical protein